MEKGTELCGRSYNYHNEYIHITYYINHLLEENQATWCKSFYVNIYLTEDYKPGERDINSS